MKHPTANSRSLSEMHASSLPAQGLVTAVVDGADAHGRPRISWHGGPARPITAEVVWLEKAVDWSSCPGINVIVGFIGADQARPIILGLLSAPPALHATEAPVAVAEAVSQPKTLRFESSEELVLECGKSKISLRADGRITIMGGYLVSEASGPNKIRGGSVQIN